MDQQKPAGETPDTAARARHGYRNEVNWEGGSGRQPYSNQGRQETPSPAAGEQAPEGNRTQRSGNNVEQFDRVRRKP